MAGGASLFALGLSAALQVSQGSTQRSIANDRARQIEKIGQLEAEEARREGRKLRGKQVAALSASGIDPGFGSALAVLNEGATEYSFVEMGNTGRAEIVADGATDLPFADIEGRNNLRAIKTVGIAVKYSRQDCRPVHR